MPLRLVTKGDLSVTNPRLAAALDYLENRQWAVIPLHPKTKKAMIKWKPYSKRLPTDNEVRSWWRRFPEANVGVVTGAVSGIVVVDVDPDKGGDGPRWAAQFPTDLVSKTGRGGLHLYYEYPPNAMVVRNSASKVAPGVDVRGDGGYVAAPPSLHPNGKNYAWTIDGAIGEAPPFDVVWQEPLHASNGANGTGTIATEHWLERVLKGVGSGERNDACARLAGYFLGRKIPADVVLEQLFTWNKQNDPPLALSEIRQTVDSVARTAADKRKQANSYVLEPDEESDKEIGLYDTIGLDAYLSKYGDIPLTWLVRDWLPAQTVGMVVAPPGSYKTWLLQDLAVSVATGAPFLGKFPIERPGPVLFMQQEDWHGQIAHRFSLIASRRFGMEPPHMKGDMLHLHVPPKIPVHLHEHRRFKFEDKDVVDAWVEQIKRIRPALVILDPLYSAGSVEDFMAGTARSMFLFKSIRDSLGTAFLIAHHTRKAARESNGGRGAAGAASSPTPEREDVWGSQFLNAWMETGWQIRKREELGTATIARHFKVSNDAKHTVLGFNIDTTMIPGKYEVSVKETQAGEADGPDLVAVLEKKGKGTMPQLVEWTGLHRTTIFRRLKNLQSAGVVILQGSHYALSPSGLEVQNAVLED